MYNGQIPESFLRSWVCWEWKHFAIFFYYIDFISSLQISISESHLSAISNINLCCFLALTEVSLLQIIYYTNKTRFYTGVDDKGEKEKGSNNSSFVTTSLIEKTALRVTLHNSWPQEKCCWGDTNEAILLSQDTRHQSEIIRGKNHCTGVSPDYKSYGKYDYWWAAPWCIG